MGPGNHMSMVLHMMTARSANYRNEMDDWQYKFAQTGLEKLAIK